MPQPPPPPAKPLTHSQQADLVGNWARIHCGTATPFLRFGGGSHAHAQAHYTLVILIYYASLVPAIRYYIVLWGLMIFYNRIRANRSENSGFDGYQWPLAKYMHDRTARIIEILAVLAVGLATRRVSLHLGNMIASTALSLSIVLAVRLHTIPEIQRQDADARAQMAYRARIARGGDW